jgi:hypothetical protein
MVWRNNYGNVSSFISPSIADGSPHSTRGPLPKQPFELRPATLRTLMIPMPVSDIYSFVVYCLLSLGFSAIFVTLEHIVNAPANTVDTVVQANIFYNGPSLPPNIFGDFLSIPASNKSLSRLSYADIVANTFPTNDDHGSTYLYGSSTRKGGDEKSFVDALNFNFNFTQSLKRDLAWTALTFTPIPDSQIKAGRARGGNAIDAPLTGGYAVMQIMQTLPVGVVDVPPAVAKGKQQLLNQYVTYIPSP